VEIVGLLSNEPGQVKEMSVKKPNSLQKDYANLGCNIKDVD